MFADFIGTTERIGIEYVISAAYLVLLIVAVVLVIQNKKLSYAAKVLWILAMVIIPVGSIVYLIWNAVKK